jgi:putative membrane protein
MTYPPQDENLNLAYERTRLAAERTFLSWIRTGLTSVAAGLGVARLLFFRTPFHQHVAHIIGSLLVLWGLIAFVFAFWSYRKSYVKTHLNLYNPQFFWQMSCLIFTLITLVFVLFLIL